MLVGLASVQLMTLRQSLGVILGSDLGTTMTVQLFAFKFYLIAPLLITVGFAISFLWKSGHVFLTGKLILAIGFVFFGMQLMAEASGALRSYPLVESVIRESFGNPWIGLAVGIFLTTVIQSSAATLAIAIAMAQQFTFADHSAPGLAHFLPIVLGANIGTCSTAFLAILQAETEGVRVAWAHLSFKVIGTMLALPGIWLLRDITILSSWPVALQIAALHTAFSVFIAIIFLPLIPQFDTMIRRFVQPRKETSLRFRVEFLNDKVAPFPVLALSQATKELSRASEQVMRMVEESLELISRFDFSRKRRIIDKDDEVDFLHEQIMAFLTRIAREELGSGEARRASMLIMVTTDIEHIGDIVSKSIAELAEKMDRSPTPLSAEGKKEISDFFIVTIDLLREAFAAFTLNDRALAGKVFERKSAIKTQFSSFVDYHMNRLYKRKVESLQTTSIHIDLLEEINRINHFTFRIAGHVMKGS
jgi:phosphate:Na+ symporter